MKPIAIVYTSNTGFTAEYASLLGGETGLPVYALEDAKKACPKTAPSSIWAGWRQERCRVMTKQLQNLTLRLCAPWA